MGVKFKKTHKKGRFSCGSQVGQLICGNMNQKLKREKKHEFSLDDQILEDKKE